MSSMLGADLGSLDSLAARLRVTTDRLGGVSGDAQTIADQVTTQMIDAFDQAVSRVTSAMDEMTVAVAEAVAEAHGSIWTGHNKAVFSDAASQFDASVIRMSASTTQAWAEFRAHAERTSAMVLEFQSGLIAELGASQEATTSMAAAVDAQSASLDATMNSGMALG